MNLSNQGNNADIICWNRLCKQGAYTRGKKSMCHHEPWSFPVMQYEKENVILYIVSWFIHIKQLSLTLHKLQIYILNLNYLLMYWNETIIAIILCTSIL